MASEFIAPMHPLVMKMLDKLLPGKRVKNFSIHFPIDGVVTLKAEICLDEVDAEAIGLFQEYEFELHEKASNDCSETGSN